MPKSKTSSRQSGNSGSGESNYIVNWHLQYSSSIVRQAELSIGQMRGNILSEISKINADIDYIKKYDKKTDITALRRTQEDLRDLLEETAQTSEEYKRIAARIESRLF